MKMGTNRIGVIAVALAAALGTTLLSTADGATTQQAATAQTKSAAPVKGEGAAFAMTNAAAGNEIVRYRRSADGTLKRVGSTSTKGLGIGVDLDTQGPLRLSEDHRLLSRSTPAATA